METSDESSRCLQRDLDKLALWSTIWKLDFNPSKCCVLRITNKKVVSTIHQDYFLYGTRLEVCETHPYLGVQLFKDLKWNHHVNFITKKTTRTLNLIRRNLYSFSKEVKARAYLSLVRPTLSYASSVWDPYTQKNINQLEMVQRCATRFAFKNYLRHVSVSALIKELGWSELSSARKRDRLCMMFKIVNNLIPIHFNDQLSYCKTETRRNHPQKLNILAPRTEQNVCRVFRVGLKYIQTDR